MNSYNIRKASQNSFSLKNNFSGIRTYLDARYSRTVYTIAILTMHGVNSTLQHDTNISKSEIITKWSVTVTYIIALCMGEMKGTVGPYQSHSACGQTTGTIHPLDV